MVTLTVDIKIIDSSVKHIQGKEQDLIMAQVQEIEVVKEEFFAFQLLIKGDHPFLCTLGRTKDIHWTGLGDTIRIEASSNEDIFTMNFLGYVENDDGSIVGDPLLKQQSLYIEDGYRMIWVNGKVPAAYGEQEIPVELKAYYTKGYEKEELILQEKIVIKVINYVNKSAKEGEFYLDLWQHPSNWARAYEVDYFSDEHFEIIDHYAEELSQLGQRVIDLIVTDYPWAGQRCYRIEENPSNLFEFNIIKVSKNKDRKIVCDFSSFDRYIEIFMKHGIHEEINLFGMIGNWDAYSFGNPIPDYKDPMRINYYDEKEECFDYIKTKDELKSYFSHILYHLVEIGLWDKVRVVSDEPNNVELFKGAITFIQSAIPDHKVIFKCAIHDQAFFKQFGNKVQSISFNTCEVVKNMNDLSQIQQEVHDKNGRITWYSCCFPDDLNIFIKSPLIESRLNGWFTYYWNFDGFLRWSYAIWPSNPFDDITYKYPNWNAGDMFFVYPGKDLKPIGSVREKNFLFGIQDFNIFKEIEKTSIPKAALITEMEALLGKKEQMEFVPERSVKMSYSLDPSSYQQFRNNLIKKYLV